MQIKEAVEKTILGYEWMQIKEAVEKTRHVAIMGEDEVGEMTCSTASGGNDMFMFWRQPEIPSIMWKLHHRVFLMIPSYRVGVYDSIDNILMLYNSIPFLTFFFLNTISCEFIVSIATKSDSVSDIEARFTDICKPEEAEHYLFAFVLYSVRRLSESNSDNSNSETDEKGITLCQILRVAKLNLVDFFKEVPQFIVKVGPILCNLYGPNWENKLEAN
ncbi:hypothetical protein POM88_026516 [Heracleum sosnowskyi]|uniref:Retinoblastoma-associated protein N-terminal domain-containing protein n=1 Tax=Heracleum sosnowskyi TaxID=360622 RepID=A0AAD8MNZ4_9APIA|nr:hypothetical protein POM88_026516 [Heracleum sosnowskyi]